MTRAKNGELIDIHRRVIQLMSHSCTHASYSSQIPSPLFLPPFYIPFPIYHSVQRIFSEVNPGLSLYICTTRKLTIFFNKKHLKNVGPIRHCEPLHCHSPGVATVAQRLRIDVHNDDDNNDNENA